MASMPTPYGRISSKPSHDPIEELPSCPHTWSAGRSDSEAVKTNAQDYTFAGVLQDGELCLSIIDHFIIKIRDQIHPKYRQRYHATMAECANGGGTIVLRESRISRNACARLVTYQLMPRLQTNLSPKKQCAYGWVLEWCASIGP